MLDTYHRRPAVEKFTGLSRSLIYDLMARNQFPRPILIGRRAVAWKESDLVKWQAAHVSDVA